MEKARGRRRERGKEKETGEQRHMQSEQRTEGSGERAAAGMGSSQRERRESGEF